MWIKSIKVKNFKSLVDFQLDLAKFTCLIGLNGSGKSTVLQFLDFLAQLMRGKLERWLYEERHWKADDLLSKLGTGEFIEFKVYLRSETEERDEWYWHAVFDPSKLRTVSESIKTPTMKFDLKNGALTFEGLAPDWLLNHGGDLPYNVLFTYQGSILAQLDESLLLGGREKGSPGSLLEFRRFISEIRSLDLLSPELLRQKARKADGSLGLGGQQLPAFLYEIGHERRLDLLRKLQTLYPRLVDLNPKILPSGEKQLEIQEAFEGRGFTTEARHINDGMLRLIAILAELQTGGGVAVFDEIENGINPELVEFVIDALTSAEKQAIVTTHSPMILNYLTDDDAKAGVMYLYKTDAGATQAVPFFEIPSLAEKLTVMGPGEAFVDTNLTQLADEIVRMPKPETRDDVLPAQRRRGH
ncbi:MAG: AAA family ATPase [Paludisphaera borealis]|uniref:AAA family ATPase n=1 Tax=Paludisphaera borealis TaxID=1387353 RepID=UPI002845BFFC|nr:AAA family ATPase [Paludisphaera borealis]MDR3622282.1 AAA family ATPase [Paludisphaera borealis]